MVTLSSCLIWQTISIILPLKEYGCVYAWTALGSRPANDLQKMPILTKKKSSFQMKLILILAATHTKRVLVWCEFWSRGIIELFFRKWARRGRYGLKSIDCNGLSMLIFEEKRPNDASGPKSAPNSDSFWVRRLFNVCVRVFCVPNATILLVYIPAKIKMSVIWKDDFFCQNRHLL